MDVTDDELPPALPLETFTEDVPPVLSFDASFEPLDTLNKDGLPLESTLLPLETFTEDVPPVRVFTEDLPPLLVFKRVTFGPEMRILRDELASEALLLVGELEDTL